MAEHIEKLDRKYRDNKGVVVNVIGYEFECAAPLIIFRARFARVEE